MCDTWNSKIDAIRDIANISGLCGPSQGIVLDRPTTRKEQDNETKELMDYFGLSVVPQQCDSEISIKPDLENISNLINLVRDCNEIPTYSEPEMFHERPQKIIISKMNPNAREFVPKSATTNSSNTNRDIGTSDQLLKVDAKQFVSKITSEKRDEIASNDVESNSKQSVECNQITIKNPVTPKENEIEIVGRKLKSTIKGFCSQDTHKSKVGKNAVLASLLKLYTRPKLLTPEYFETTKTSKPSQKEEKYDSPVESSSNHHDNLESEPQNEEPPVQVIDESIRKVEQWLGGSTKCADVTEEAPKVVNKEVLPKKATLAVIPLDNISYKRKSVNGVKSPNITDESSSVSTPPAPKIYTPSKQAETLFEKFIKDKGNKVNKSETIWDKAERCMREKEMKLRSKQNGPCL